MVLSDESVIGLIAEFRSFSEGHNESARRISLNSCGVIFPRLSVSNSFQVEVNCSAAADMVCEDSLNTTTHTHVSFLD